MSTRAVKRILDQREAQNTSPKTEEEVEESSSEEEVEEKRHGFAALMMDDDEDGQQDSEEEQPESNKNDEQHDQQEEETMNEVQEPKLKPKKNKSKKKKQAVPAQQKDISWKEFNKVIQDVQKENKKQSQDPKNGSGIIDIPQEQQKAISEAKILKIDARYLDQNAQMRKMFGAAIVKEDLRQRSSGKGKKTLLTKPSDNWPRLVATSIDAKPVRTERDLKYYRYTHNRRYVEAQFWFYQAIVTFDPQQIMAVLRQNPWHVDSLLAMNQVMYSQEDYTAAADYLDRALYVLETALPASFALASQISRLLYHLPGNRAMHLALNRHIHNLSRKGLSRSAFEIAKLLRSLDPSADPCGTVWLIDFLAIRAEEYDWIRQASTCWSEDVSQRPGWRFSNILARAAKEDEDMLEEMQAAILDHPYILLPLLDKTGVSVTNTALSHTWWENAVNADQSEEPSADTLYRLECSIYVNRNAPLWKEPRFANLLRSAAAGIEIPSDIHRKAISERIQFDYDEPHPSLFRHIAISTDLKGILVPSSVKETVWMHDPYPPLDGEEDPSFPSPENIQDSFRRQFDQHHQQPDSDPEFQYELAQSLAGSDDSDSENEQHNGSTSGWLGYLRSIANTFTGGGANDEVTTDEASDSEDHP